MEQNQSESQINLSHKKIGSGLVFGKFMPMHEGHVNLLNFASNSTQRLTILVGTMPHEPIPGEIRFQWVKKQFPNANVIHQNEVLPQDPSEHPDFWNIWKENIKGHCPNEEFDVLFGSEDYGWKMAEVLGITYIPVDRVRDLVPISGTEMRTKPMKNWDYLPNVVRPYFLKRVAIVGPESTGKSTLTKKLAEYYETAFVGEYARSLLDEYVAHKGYQPGEVRYEDIPTIARGQCATEDSLAYRANRVLFCDTELLTTVFWSDHYFKKCPEWIEHEAQKRKYDLYILLEPDISNVDDTERPMTDVLDRQNYAAWWEQTLTKKGDPFIKVKGNWNERMAKSVKAIDELIEAHTYKPLKVAIFSTDAVIFSMKDGILSVLLIPIIRPPHFTSVHGFPGGIVGVTESAEEANIRHLETKGGIDVSKIHLEQFHTFSDPDRDPRGRAVSVAFIGFATDTAIAPDSHARFIPIQEISKLAYDHAHILDEACAYFQSKLMHSDTAESFLPDAYSKEEVHMILKEIADKKKK